MYSYDQGTNCNSAFRRFKMVKKIVSLMVILLTVSIVQANILTNGDFELGNTGFDTDYPYIPYITYQWFRYTVDTNPLNVHPSWLSYCDHTTGSGYMMIVDGATTLDKTVWQQSISIEAGKDYELSFWLATSSLHTLHLSTLEVFINDVPVGVAIAPDNLLGIWERHAFDWNSGASATATIKLVDLETEVGGNDFTLDDIKVVPIEEAAMNKLEEAIDVINDLPEDVFKNPNSRTALINKLNATLKTLSEENYEDVLGKLKQDLIQKTDGCANEGAPDSNDWIVACEAQEKIYPLIIRAIELVEKLLG